MNNIDKRGKLEEEFFSYKIVKDNRVFIYWYEKEVMKKIKAREID